MALTSSLSAYYSFEWNSNDLSGSGYNWTDTSITYSASYGKMSQWALFNGTSSYISTPSRTTGASITINVWFKRWWWNWWIIIWRDTATSRCFYVNIDDTAGWWTLDFSTFNTSWTYYWNSAAVWVAAYNTWFHMLTAIYESWVSSRIYLDWILQSTLAVTLWLNTWAEAITIWRRDYSWSPIYWNGNLDELWVWNRILTASEITELYNWWTWLTYPFNKISNFFMFL